MAKIKYDVTDQEVVEDRDFSTPVPTGVYTVRLTECEQTVSSNDNPMLACTLEIVGGEFDGRYLWDNITLIDSTEWKLAQFVRALQLKDKGALDTEKIIGTIMKARVKHETYKPSEDEPARVTAKVAALLAMPEDEEEPDEEVDEDEEDDTDEEPEAEESEDEEEDEDDEEETPPYTEWSITELTAEVKERGMKVATSKKGAAKKKYLIQKLEQDDEKDNDGNAPF